jgi:Tol biopolymer transport system component
VPFDAGRMETKGGAIPIVDKLTVGVTGDLNFGVSRTGDFAYQANVFVGSRIMLVDRHGGAREAGTDTGRYYAPRFSPDGKRVALVTWTDARYVTRDIWILDLAQRTRTRLTFDTTADLATWAPDGKKIAYARYPKGLNSQLTTLWRVAADGSGAPESLAMPAGLWLPGEFEPSGRALLLTGAPNGHTKGEIWALPLAGGGEPHVVLAGGFNNIFPSLSPDGKWMAYQSNESGRYEIYVRPYPGPGGRWQVSLEGGTEPKWSPTGKDIFYRDGDKFVAAAVRTVPAFEVTGRTVLFSGTFQANPIGLPVTNYDVTKDGQTFVMLQQAQSTELSVYVTLNWFDQFRAKK